MEKVYPISKSSITQQLNNYQENEDAKEIHHDQVLQVGARLKSLGVEYLLTFHRRRLLFPVSLYSSYEQQERHKLGVKTSKFTVTILSDYNS